MKRFSSMVLWHNNGMTNSQFHYTDNMERMFEDIMQGLFSCIPEEHVDYCFEESYPVNTFDFVENVIFEFIKHSYYESLPKHSLRHYVPYSADEDDHSERMRFQRSLNYAQHYKDLNYDAMGRANNWDSQIMKDYECLLKKDMGKMKSRIEGYELSEMDIFEHENIQNLRIIKSIVEQRLCSSKKVSNRDFIDIFTEYDNWVIDLINDSKKSQDKMLFNSMAYFTIEWKYSLEFIYSVADYMEKNNIEEADQLVLRALALPLSFQSRLGVPMSGDNRMIKERQRLIPDFISKESYSPVMKIYIDKYVEIVGLIMIFNNLTSVDGGLYKDWFKRNTDKNDWVSFLEEFDLFSTWHKKEWTNKKISLVRKLIKQMYPFKF